jgi:LysM repeat protein
MENYPDKNVSQPKDNPTSKSKYHTVAKGDTLSHIAHKYKTSVKKLCALNNIKPDHKLKIGQQLKVKN